MGSPVPADDSEELGLLLALGRRAIGTAFSHNHAKNARAVPSLAPDAPQQLLDRSHRDKFASESVLHRLLDYERTAHRPKVEDRARRCCHGDAVDHGDVERIERLGLVHDHAVVTRSPPSRTRDLDEVGALAGKAPQRCCRTM